MVTWEKPGALRWAIKLFAILLLLLTLCMSTTSTVFQLVTQKALRDDAKSGFKEDYALPCSKLYSSFTRTVVNMKIFCVFQLWEKWQFNLRFPILKAFHCLPKPKHSVENSERQHLKERALSKLLDCITWELWALWHLSRKQTTSKV